MTEQDRTIFLSTHTMAVAEEVCDQISIIHRGEILATGTMKELRDMSARENSSLEDIFLTITEEKIELHVSKR